MGQGKEGGSRCFGLGGVPVSPLGEEGEGGFRNVEAVEMSSFTMLKLSSSTETNVFALLST